MSKANQQKIFFHYLTESFTFTNRNRLKAFLEKKTKAKGRKIETINYIFCNDSFLLEINKEHLGHDDYTDIITFELSSKNQPLLSDIYISVERVKENAIKFNSSFANELHRVIFHGALHLLGLKDKSPSDIKQMRKAETDWLKEYFVSRGTVSR